MRQYVFGEGNKKNVLMFTEKKACYATTYHNIETRKCALHFLLRFSRRIMSAPIHDIIRH